MLARSTVGYCTFELTDKRKTRLGEDRGDFAGSALHILSSQTLYPPKMEESDADLHNADGALCHIKLAAQFFAVCGEEEDDEDSDEKELHQRTVSQIFGAVEVSASRMKSIGLNYKLGPAP